MGAKFRIPSDEMVEIKPIGLGITPEVKMA